MVPAQIGFASHLGGFLLVSEVTERAGIETLTPARSKLGQSLHLQQKVTAIYKLLILHPFPWEIYALELICLFDICQVR